MSLESELVDLRGSLCDIEMRLHLIFVELNYLMKELDKHQKYTRAWYGLSSFNEKFRAHMNDPDEEATVLKYWRSRGTNPQYDEFIEAHGIDQEYIDLFKKVKANAGAYDKEMDLESIIESIRDEINTEVLFKVYKSFQS